MGPLRDRRSAPGSQGMKALFKCLSVKCDTARRGVRLALALCVFLLPSCASAPQRAWDSGSASVACLPSFPDRDGWYGGDGAYSIRLEDGRDLWLFGDTFVSDLEGREDRIGMKVVTGTTLAISTCTAEAGFQIRYHLKRQNGQFVSSFGDGEWLWPQDPFIVDRVLYVPLLCVRPRPELEGPFKFEIAGHRMARIRDCSGSDPNRWPVDYLELTPGIPEDIKAFATSSVVHGGYVYFYPLYGASDGSLSVLGNIMARIPTDKIDEPARAIEYLNDDGRWTDRPEPSRVRVVFDAAVSEMSVRYHRDLGKWVAVYLSIHGRGDRMMYQTAEAPEGPWAEPKVLIGRIPEVLRGGPGYDGDNFCYAGKEHPQFSTGRDLVVTYVCNSHEDDVTGTSFIRRNLFLYRPVVNRVAY